MAVGVFTLLFYFLHRHENITYPTIKTFSVKRLIPNVFIYAVFVYLTLQVFTEGTPSSLPTQLCWLLTAVLTLLSWCYFTFELNSLNTFIKRHLQLIILSVLIAGLVILINIYAYRLWEPLSTITLFSAYWILSLFFDSTYMDASQYYLGLRDFLVEISAVCSGLEGLVISLITTSIYLFFLRKELRFPSAIVLLPLAAIISIVFNIVRITLLVLIGALYSPDIAVGGFHSVAGWIAALFVAAIIVFIFSNLSFFNKESERDTLVSDAINSDENPDLAWAMLVPFIVFLFFTLASQIFLEQADGSFQFNYLYPIKAVVGAIALAYFWKTYLFKMPEKWGEPIVAGLVIAILWVLLVPADEIYNQRFDEGLSAMSTVLMLAWFFFRFLGAWIVVPFIEEMIFRGYLLSRLSKQPLSTNNTLSFSWLAFIVSSTLFALIHFSIIAGLVAGALFAVIRYRSKSLSEPILAHAAANMFVSGWAISTGQWVVL